MLPMMADTGILAYVWGNSAADLLLADCIPVILKEPDICLLKLEAIRHG